MSIFDRESSSDNATPFEIITISLGNKVFRYTTYHENLTTASVIYKAVPIEHDNPQCELQDGDVQLNIKIPYYDELGNYLIQSTPQLVIEAQIDYFDMWIQNPSVFSFTDTDYITTFKGYVSGLVIKWPWLEFNCTDIFTSGNRIGLRRHYSRQCPYVLYDKNCKVMASLHYYNVKIIDYSSRKIQMDISIPENQCRGGKVVFMNTLTQTNQQAMITSNKDNVLNLSNAVNYIKVGSQAQAYWGCAHVIEECRDKFNNMPNCGAFPFVPAVNIFGSVNSTSV